MEAVTMAKVEYSKENVEKCWCGSCPVQSHSACAKELYEASKASEELGPPESMPGLYCATGKATCDDLQLVNLCNCPACLVWGENDPRGNHYCLLGADQG
jgi:hypothetical protein